MVVPVRHSDRTPVVGPHSAIDAHSRLAFSEILANEQDPTRAGFWERAQQFFAAHAITVEAVLTDNAKNYLGFDFTAALHGIEHRRIRPHRPTRTKGRALQPDAPRRVGLRARLPL